MTTHNGRCSGPLLLQPLILAEARILAFFPISPSLSRLPEIHNPSWLPPAAPPLPSLASFPQKTKLDPDKTNTTHSQRTHARAHKHNTHTPVGASAYSRAMPSLLHLQTSNRTIVFFFFDPGEEPCAE